MSMNIETATKILRTFFREQKRLPSYQEMCDLFHFASKKASYDLAAKLIQAGIITKDEKGKLVPKKMFLPLPVLGSIQAGYPMPAEQQIIDTLSFDQYLIDQPETSYILKVSGDSMIEAGIHPGDIVVIDSAKRVREGDIVVANVDNEWTLKYLRKDKGKVFLVPANKRYKPIMPRSSLSVAGVVVSVIRKYN